MNNTPTPRTDEIEGNLIEFCDNPIRFPKMTEHSRQLEKELTAVTEQRDRLAEAIEHTMKHMRHSLNCPARLSEGLHACNCQMEWSYDNAAEALQSLNPDHTVDAKEALASVKGGNYES